MDTREIQTKINWYGTDYQVRVEWDSMSGDVIAVRCFVNTKAVVKLVKGRWIDKKGKRYDSEYFTTLNLSGVRADLQHFSWRRDVGP